MRDARLSCPREPEVLDLVAVGGWPTRAESELQVHVRTCRVCDDLASIAVALADLRDIPVPAPHLPDAALVWHRSQMRARQDAIRKAAQPLLFAQAAALAVAAGCLLVWAGGLGDIVTTATSGTWQVVSAWTGRARELPQVVAATSDFIAGEPARLWLSYGGQLLTGLAAVVAVIGTAFGLSRLADGGGH